MASKKLDVFIKMFNLTGETGGGNVHGVTAEYVAKAVEELKEEITDMINSLPQSQNTSRIYTTDTEPEDWQDGDLWLAPVDENIPTPIEVATIPFDSTKPFHLELDDITETLLNTTDNEQTATEDDLIIV